MKKPFTARGRLFLMISAVVALTSVFNSCKKEQKTYNENSIELTLNQIDSTANTTTQKWHITNKRVCVLFGYDFNNPEIKEFVFFLVMILIIPKLKILCLYCLKRISDLQKTAA